MTYYDILGVPHNATQEQIKQAFRMQIRFFHPDLFEGPPEVADIKTKQLNEAYGVLGNPELRRQYDIKMKSNTHEPPKQNQEKQDYTKDDIYTAYAEFARVIKEEREEAEKERKKKKRRKIFWSIVVIALAVDFVGGVITGNIKLWPETKETTPATSYNDNKQELPETNLPKPVTKPVSGTVLSGEEVFDGSEIKVIAASNSDYVVSLKDSNGTLRVAFYVRAGQVATVGVPAEHLYVYFASGDTWYGYGKGKMFGEETYYSKDDELMDFTQYTWEYELQPVTNGNFSETPSNANEFF